MKINLSRLAILCAATLPLVAITPVHAQQTVTVTGSQTTSAGSNARLSCGEVRLPRQGQIVKASTSNTNGFWINRGSAKLVSFAQASQAVGYSLKANDTYYVCPDAPSRSGTSSVTIQIRY